MQRVAEATSLQTDVRT